MAYWPYRTHTHTHCGYMGHTETEYEGVRQ